MSIYYGMHKIRIQKEHNINKFHKETPAGKVSDSRGFLMYEFIALIYIISLKLCIMKLNFATYQEAYFHIKCYFTYYV